MPRISAVTFDYWDTLMVSAPPGFRDARVDALLGLIEGEGFAAERQAVNTGLDAAFSAFERAWHANEQYRAHDAIDVLLCELGLDVSETLRDALVDAVVGGTHVLEMAPNSADTLRALKGAGVRLGIVCDVGWTPSPALRSELDRHGVLELFDHWSFSDEVGHYKPHAEIFRHAHEGLGVEDPATAAHVGDLRRTDIAGARDLGAVAVRYAGVFDDRSDRPDGDHVITDHAELPGVLGIRTAAAT